MSGTQYRALSAMAVLLLGGCLAGQVRKDGSSFRDSLLDMYTEQQMDNLIAAYENRPFVQLSYRALQVTDEKMDKLTASNELDTSTVSTFARATGALMSAMTTIVDKVGLTGSTECDRTMNFHADPVVTTTAVYEYYRAYAASPDLFCCSDREPCGNVYLKKKCGCRWYWVPEEASGVFLQLALKTTFMTGTDMPPPVSYAAVICRADFMYDKDGRPIIFQRNQAGTLTQLDRVDPHWNTENPPKGLFNYVIGFDRPLPNGEGSLTVRLPSGPVKLVVRPDLTQPSQKDVARLYAQSWTYINPAVLPGRPVDFYSADHPPPLPEKTGDQLRLEEAVKRFRSIPRWQP